MESLTVTLTLELKGDALIAYNKWFEAEEIGVEPSVQNKAADIADGVRADFVHFVEQFGNVPYETCKNNVKCEVVDCIGV